MSRVEQIRYNIFPIPVVKQVIPISYESTLNNTDKMMYVPIYVRVSRLLPIWGSH